MNRIIARTLVLSLLLSVGSTVASAQTLEVNYANHLSGQSSNAKASDWNIRLQSKANDHIKAEVRGGEVICPPCALAGYAVCTDSNNCPSSATTSKMVSCGAMTVQQALALQQAQIALAAMQSGEVSSPVMHFPNEGPTFTYDLEVGQKYLGGNGAIFHDGSIVRNSLTGYFGDVYANIWLQNGFDDSRFSSNPGDELNYSLGFTGDRGGFVYDIGVIYIDAVGLGKMPNGDVWGPYAEWTHAGKLGLLSRFDSVRIESYIPGGDRVEGGWLIHLREKVSWSASNGWGVDLSLGPTFDDGAFGFEPGIIGVVEVGVSVPLGGLVLNPGYRISTPIEGASDRETVYGWSLSTSVDF